MDKLRIGVVGTGSVVREIYQYLYFRSEYSHLLSIEAAADPNEKALTEFCQPHDIPRDRRFSSLQQMIRAVELDAVQVNTPDSLHEEPTVHALKAGLDVLVPKPTADGIAERNALFRNFEPDGSVSGYGISHPGRLYERLLNARQGTLSAAEREALCDPLELGFWTTVVLEAAEQSLKSGRKGGEGVVAGADVDVPDLLRCTLGDAAQSYL